MKFTPQFSITPLMANGLTAIERARAFLEAAHLSESWLKTLQAKNLLLEAYHTTHIEGTELTLDQSEKLFAGESLSNVNPDDAKELLNYRKAFDLVAGYLGGGESITEGLIREIHKRLVKDVRGDAAAPGEYRKIQNYVMNAKTKQVIYTPPPAYEVPLMMAELVNWLNTEAIIHPVLMAGIAQFQLVHIHPFLDGNGRTARLLSTLCLYQRGYDFKRLFTISEYYDRNRTDYYRAIQSVRENTMNMTDWLAYFTEGLATQLQEVQEQSEKAIKVQALASTESLKTHAVQVLEFLVMQGRATLSECETALAINRRTLQRDLKQLIEKGFIKEVATSPTDPTKYYEPRL